MKATELRIGNHVLINQSDNTWTICVVDYELIGLCQREPDKVKPLPITIEMLLDFGFTQKNKSRDYYAQWYSLHKFLLYFESAATEKPLIIVKYEFTATDDTIFEDTLKHIRYAHEIQNLFFALTEEELKTI